MQVGAAVNTRIGPLAPENAGEVLTIQRAAYLAEGRRYDAWDIPPLTEDVDSIAEDIAALLASGMPVLGAWHEHRLVGSVRGRVDGARMEVARLSVAPDLRRRGIGRALLEAVGDARPPGVRVLWLMTGAESHDNLRLYESAGYVPVGDRLDAVGVRLLVLEKAVAATPAIRA